MMRHHSFTILCSLMGALLCRNARADLISIYNMTDENVWVATYYDTGSRADRVGPACFLARQSSRTIERPKRRVWSDRVLVYDYDKRVLAATYDKRSWHDVNKKNIGYTNGSTYYLAKKNGILSSYSTMEWMLYHPISNIFQELSALIVHPLKEYIKVEQVAISQNPYKNTTALVRTGDDLCSHEKEYLAKRMPVVKHALEEALGHDMSDAYVPRIAFVASGGGYRAMISTVGWLVGAQKAGLLDAVTYASVLSGSTWALATWYSSGMPIQEFRDQLIQKMDDGLISVSLHDIELIKDQLLVKLAYEQPLSLVDLYGALLANVLLRDFGDDRHRIYLSSHAQQVLSGAWMLPIYTAVRADKQAEENSGWCEFTPFEIGATWLGSQGCYIPTWAIGREFVEGVSVDDAPEQSLGFLMGVFGSAFAARMDQIYATIRDQIPSKILSAALAKLMVDHAGDERLGCAQLNNFAVGMRRPIENEPIMTLVDAGANPGFNLPYPPISGQRPERSVDMIIFLDASGGAEKYSELKRAEEYARAHALKFPVINYDSIQNNAITLFRDEHDASIPVVLYMPLVNDPMLAVSLKQPEYSEYRLLLKNFDVTQCMTAGDCGTMNFRYDLSEARRLCTLVEFNVVANHHVIKEAIADIIKNKK